MPGAFPSSVRDLDWTAVVGAALVAAGVALTVYGAYLHVSIAGRVSAGRCDGCDPWHPLLVVAPLVLGSALVLGGAGLRSRR